MKTLRFVLCVLMLSALTACGSEGDDELSKPEPLPSGKTESEGSINDIPIEKL